MFKILGRLLGLEKEDLGYNRELLLFNLMIAVLFLVLGFNHTENGAKFLYANKLNQVVLVKIEKEGISNADIDKISSEFKEIVPINIIEYDITDIKDNLQIYANSIKSQNKVYLTDLLSKLEAISENDDKKVLVKQLREINVKLMLKDYSKEEIVKRNLLQVADWQTNIFLSNIYFILGVLTGLSFIIIKVVCEISLFDKKEKRVDDSVTRIKIDELS
jgi:hypothetical protein